MVEAFIQSFAILVAFHVTMRQLLYEWETNFNQKRVYRSSKSSPSYHPFYRSRKKHINDPKSLASLNMDHVHLVFKQFIWSLLLVWPFLLYAFVKGLAMFKLKHFLQKRSRDVSKNGNGASADYASKVATLILETSLVINCIDIETDVSSHPIAVFEYDNVHFIDMNGEVKVMNLCRVKIDLQNMELLSMNVDGTSLNAKQSYILLAWYLASSHHAKVHSVANWSVEPTREAKSLNPFYYQNSICTIMYNYYGYNGFPQTVVPLLSRLGIFHPNFTSSAMRSCIDSGIAAGVPEHSRVVKLTRYSALTKFLVRLRPHFHRAFVKYKRILPNADAESLFVGTVIHSLDHYSYEQIVDPFLLDEEDTLLGEVAKITQVVRATFTSDIPVPFVHRYKDSRHPFYLSVYEKAREIDQRFADEMDTCIIK